MSNTSRSSSFPLIAHRSDDTAIILGSIGDIFKENFTEFGHPKPIPWSTDVMNRNIPDSLRTLHILFGDDIAHPHEEMFKAICRHTTDNCTNLESVCILAYSTNWGEKWQDLVHNWTQELQDLLHNGRPLALFTERIIDSQRTFEAMVTYKRNNLMWQTESALMLPLDCIRAHEKIVRSLPQIKRLYLTLPLDRSTFLDHRLYIFNAFNQLLTNSPVLRTVTLPLDLSPDLISICRKLPQRPWVIELNISPEMATPREFVAGLAACFRDFHFLRKLSLPSNVLCNVLIDCLGDLQGLQEQTIVATSPVPTVTLTHHAHDKFLALQTLILLGSTALQQDIEAVVRAFSGSRVSVVKKIKVEAKSLCSEKEMKRTLGTILRYCPKIDELDICINGTTDAEGSDWVNLSHLRNFSLRVFKIQHPRPIPLTDECIRRFLKAWPSAESVSFNPHPILPRKSPALAAQSPTVDCLTHVARHGRNLRHFGVFLDPQPQYSLPSLEELDLGSVDVERMLLEGMFPNAIRV